MEISKFLSCETIGSGCPLVLLHGWGFNAKIWESIAIKLSQQFCVTMMDLPGHGNSREIDDDFDLSKLASAIVALLPQPAIYLGWSLGGLVAMAVAQYYPQHVKQLITVASSPCFVAQNNWPGVDKKILQQFREDLEHDCQKTFQRFLALQLLGKKRTVCGYRQQIINFSQNIPSKKTLRQGLDWLNNVDFRQDIKQLCCPQLHFLGELDPILPLGLAAAWQKLVPLTKIITLPQVGHVPFISQEEQFLQQLLSHVGIYG